MLQGVILHEYHYWFFSVVLRPEQEAAVELAAFPFFPVRQNVIPTKQRPERRIASALSADWMRLLGGFRHTGRPRPSSRCEGNKMQISFCRQGRHPSIINRAANFQCPNSCCFMLVQDPMAISDLVVKDAVHAVANARHSLSADVSE